MKLLFKKSLKNKVLILFITIISLFSCEEKETSQVCFEPIFSSELIAGTTYNFTPEFEIIDVNSTVNSIKEGYILKFYVDGIYQSEALGAAWDNGSFTHTFSKGIHEVCFELSTNDCADVQTSCQTIEVKDCFEPQFSYQIDASSKQHVFTPNFEIIDKNSTVNAIKEGYILKFYIDGVYQSEALGASWDNGDFKHKFEPGTYEICFELSTNECTELQKSCKTITIL
ncbi:hypothetical protein [Polaribacter staleyi]|uniref:hypothetical protein n=1 Tax=Polaribacter staleyi TaxID=2022337 RepID=UPI0031BA9EC3